MARRGERTSDIVNVAKVVAAFVVAIAVSAWLAVQGTFWGWAGLVAIGGGGLFFGAMLLLESLEKRPAWRRSAVRHGTLRGAERLTNTPYGVVFPARRASVLLSFAGALVFGALAAVFVLIGVLKLRNPGLTGLLDALLWLVPSAGALALLGPLGAYSLVSLSGGGLLVTEEGVFGRGAAGTVWVPWSEVQEVDEYARFPLELRLRTDPPPSAVRDGGPRAWWRAFRRSPVADRLRLPTRDIGAPHLAHDLLSRGLRDAVLRSRLGTPALATELSARHLAGDYDVPVVTTQDDAPPHAGG